jgi:hypothetical protein
VSRAGVRKTWRIRSLAMEREERNKYAREWYRSHREQILARDKKRVKTDEQKQRHLESSRRYYAKKRAEKPKTIKPPKQLIIKFKRKIFTEEERIERRRQIRKSYRKMNKEKIKEWDRKKYLKRKSIIQEQNKFNRDVINERYLKRTNERLKHDPLFKLSRDIPKLIRISLRRNGYSKKSKTSEILGCSYEAFKKHIEGKFEPWMDWDNRGKYNGELFFGWDIDHIIPVSSAQNEEEMIKLNHYTNLQPLDSYVNRYIKRDNIVA